MGITGFYCKICRAIFPDSTTAEKHVLSEEHNMKYKVNYQSSALSFQDGLSNVVIQMLFELCATVFIPYVIARKRSLECTLVILLCSVYLVVYLYVFNSTDYTWSSNSFSCTNLAHIRSVKCE